MNLLPEVVVLETSTPGLTLRHLVADDATKLHLLLEDNEEYLEAEPSLLLRLTPEKIVEKLAEGSVWHQFFGVWHNKRLVGHVELIFDPRKGASAAKIYFWIAKRRSKKGFATAALKALTTHAFRGLGYLRLEASALFLNQAAKKVLYRSGYSISSTERLSDKWILDFSRTEKREEALDWLVAQLRRYGYVHDVRVPLKADSPEHTHLTYVLNPGGTIEVFEEEGYRRCLPEYRLALAMRFREEGWKLTPP